MTKEDLRSLVDSIAHETRNSLSAIKAASELVKSNLDEEMKH